MIPPPKGPDRPKQSLFFLHVPKTAGSTFTGVLSNRFPASETLPLYFADERVLGGVERYRYVSGHVSTAFLDRFAQRPFVITLIRDPIDRALSSYSYVRSLPDTPAPLFVPEQGPGAHERYREYQRLAPRCSIEEIIEAAPEIAREWWGNRHARALSAHGPDDGEERLEDALEGLARCDFVGLTERLDESATWLARRLGWRDLGPIPVANVTMAKVRREGLSAAALDGLLELTAVDRELYRRAERLFDQRLAEWGAADDPRDHSAEIADASATSDLSFGDAIPGGGWLSREEGDGEPPFCWMGSANRAWVEMTGEPGADSLAIEIAHAIDQDILRSMRISIDGKAVRHRLAGSNGAVVATASLKGVASPAPDRTVHVALQVDGNQRPMDVNPDSTDNRRLSIAVRRITLQAH